MMLPFLILMSLYGFSPAETTMGDVTISIADIEPVTELEEEIPVVVTIANSGTEALKGKVKLGVIDNWRIVDEHSRDFHVPPDQEQELRFKCVAGTGTCRDLRVKTRLRRHIGQDRRIRQRDFSDIFIKGKITGNFLRRWRFTRNSAAATHIA